MQNQQEQIMSRDQVLQESQQEHEDALRGVEEQLTLREKRSKELAGEISKLGSQLHSELQRTQQIHAQIKGEEDSQREQKAKLAYLAEQKEQTLVEMELMKKKKAEL